MAFRSDDQTGVMFLLNPIDNLRLIVGGSVGKFLPRQRENNAGVVSSWLQFRSGA